MYSFKWFFYITTFTITLHYNLSLEVNSVDFYKQEISDIRFEIGVRKQ